MTNKEKEKLRIINNIKNRELTPQEGLRLISALDAHNNYISFRSEWLEKNIDSESEQGILNGNTIIFDTNKKLFTALTMINEQDHSKSNIVLVTQGTSYRRISQNEYVIDLNNQEDYTKLFSDIKSDDIFPDNIIHFWSKNSFDIDEEVINKELNESFFSLFFSAKEIIKSKIGESINLFYLYQAGLSLQQPVYNGMTGFLKTLEIENPSFCCHSIGFESLEEPKEIIEVLSNELNCDVIEVFYGRDNKRYVRSYIENKQSDMSSKEEMIKRNGVYIITGGAGEIGLVIAKYIANEVECKIILTGRSPLSKEKEEQLLSMAGKGSEITYIQADISNKQDVKSLIEQVKSKYKRINGIIHSAGVVRDAFIVKKTKEQIDQVNASKIFGTIYLDEFTGTEKLDFFTMFSSVASVLGNIGQADYAYANCFMDSYAMYRQSNVAKNKAFGRSIAINWPLWESGGMTIDEATIDWLKENRGIFPLTNKNGVDAFQSALDYGFSSFIVFEGEQNKIRRLFGLEETNDSVHEKSTTSVDKVNQKIDKNISEGSETDSTTHRLKGNLISYLKELLSVETKLPISKMKEDDDFEKYGIDSVMIMNLNRELEKDFGEISKTLFFENNTVEELASHLISRYKKMAELKFGFPKESSTGQGDDKQTDRVVEDKAENSSENIKNKKRFLPSIQKQIESIQQNDITVNEEKAISEKDIAIIGLSGRYPMAKNLNEFWDNLAQGKDCITEVPKERWNWEDYYSPEKGKKGKSYSKWGGFISDADQFDPLFFNISPREAKGIDPQERVFLQTAWHTLEDAGYSRAKLSKENVGVFVGVMFNHYQLYGSEVSASSASIANRVSYFLNLTGPSIGLDTMCSSSLTAIHLAVESIKRGECDAAIAGGVNLSVHPNKYILLSQNNFPSTDGKCRSFGEGGDGYVPGEGTGAVLLKSLKAAVKDGDRILGVIKGTAINHGGKTNGYSVPNPKAQEAVISKVLKETGIHPRTIGYIEAHGTGTALGDPIEMTGLVNAFSKYTKDVGFCAIGSVKSNIGHLESAAGIAGITKVLLQLKNKKLVPSIHSKTLNPNIKFEETPFFVQQELENWNPIEYEGVTYPRRAGISSFGAGGSNGHVILEEYIEEINGEKNEDKNESENEATIPYAYVLSAKTKESLQMYVKESIEFLRQTNDPLQDICYTLQFGRERMEERVAIIGHDKEQLTDGLITISDNWTSSLNKTRGCTILYKNDRDEKDVTIIGEALHDETFSLALSWINGWETNWNSLYNDVKAEMVSVPVYPFAKEHYWMETNLNQNVPISDHEMMYFTREWKEEKPLFSSYRMDQSSLMIFYSGENKPLLPGDHHVYIRLNGYFSQINQYEYTINPNRVEDYIQLFDEIRRYSTIPTAIVNLCDAEKQSTLIHIVNELKALSKASIKGMGHVMNMYHYLNGPIHPMYESLAGFNKSIRLIMPDLKMNLIGFNDYSALNDIISNALLRKNNAEDELLYEGGVHKGLTVKAINDLAIKQQNIRQNGVYLITGGAGGLGYVFTRYLAEAYNARVCIVGRSILKGERERKINELISKGYKIDYLQGDVGNYEDMTGIIEAIKRKYGVLNGVIHAAGVSDNKPFLEKSIDDFFVSLWPKMEGTMILDEVTKNETLDFFIMFSSLSSVLGDFGQCDYAVGNRFLDAYVNTRETLRQERKRSGKTLSIQWPLWREGGMHLAAEGEDLYLQTSGMSYLELEDGIQAFNQALCSPINTMMVIVGNKEKIERLLGLYNGSADSNHHTMIHRNMEAFAKGESRSIGIRETDAKDLPLNKQVEKDLQEIASEILCVEPNRLDIRENFGNFGFDSVSLKEYSDHISDYFGINLQPTVFFAHSHIQSLAGYIINEYKETINHKYTIHTKENDELFNKERFSVGHALHAAHHSERKPDPIAIIGISGLYPGSKNIHELWEHLENEKNMIIEIPKDRWDYHDYYGEGADSDKRIETKWGGFIEDANKFDPRFFNLSPREAELMDPQHRLFLQTVWKTIEDGGYNPVALGGKNIGIFTGVQFTDYMDMLSEADKIDPQAGTGNSHAVLCNRISYLLNFKGPSEAIDTACSSSLVAIHRAVKAVQSGECELAIAGGVTIMASPDTFVGTAKLGVLSPDGQCKTFDKKANGYVRGEGVGALLLKPLSRAIEDKDHIYAVIRGSAEGHGGRANSLTAPNSEAQAELLIRAYEEAEVDIEHVSYIEAHGTGTPLGDPVEIEGLKKAFETLAKKSGKQISRNNYCGISSIKTNIGHLEPASGIAGITKIILSMKHRKLPGTLHLKELNPYIHLEQSPFYIVEKTKGWEPLLDERGNPVPRIAGVSSFGFGGSYAHVILEEYNPAKASLSERSHTFSGEQQLQSQIIVLSAKNEARLKDYAGELLKYLQDNVKENMDDTPSKNRFLREMAYTLQRGREAMGCRLAIVASTINEVMNRLEGYLKGSGSIEHLYIGSLNQKQTGEPIVKASNKSINLNELAQGWVNNEGVDLFSLFGNEKIRKCPLPTYPFAKEVYWIPKRDPNRDSLSQHGNNEKKSIMPLIDENISTLKEQKFRTKLSGDAFFLKDHVIAGNRIFPGVAYLEMAYEASQLSGMNSISRIKDVIWSSPITVDKEPREVQISLFPEEEDVIYEVYTVDENQNRTLHGQGRLYFKAPFGDSSNESIEDLVNNELGKMGYQKINIDIIKERCKNVLNSETCYEIFAQSGLEYGMSFRTISESLIGKDEALTLLDLPVSLVEDRKNFILHPSLMDGALQSVVGLQDDINSNHTYLPFSIKEIEIMGALSSQCYAYATKEDASSGLLKFNILILDTDGNVLMRIKEFSLREIKPSSDTDEPSTAEDMYFTTDWEVSHYSLPELPNHEGRILLLTNINASAYFDRYQNVVIVKNGAKYNSLTNNQYEMNFGRLEDYYALLEDLKVSGQMPSSIIHLFMPEDNEHEQGQRGISIYSIFNLCRALAVQKPTETIEIIVAYHHEINQLRPYYLSVSALLKTLSLECSKISYKTIGLNPEEDLSSKLLSELNSPDTEIIYDGEVRMVKRIVEINNTPIDSHEHLIREGGVYVITGGLGGLGFIFAKYLAKQYKAKLILTGRSKLDSAKKDKLLELTQLGTEGTYIQSDISKPNDVKRLIKEVKAKYENINGILHCAGIIKDAYLMNKTEEDFVKVLSPKIDGTMYLDEATQDEPLDFFILFSSFSSIAGNPGQGDYAYANSFMDNFARYRNQMVEENKRHGKAISINWPLWRQGGMKVDQQVEKMLESRMGMKLLDIEEGIKAFEKSLIADTAQFIVISGYRKRVIHALFPKKEERSVAPLSFNEDELFEKVQKDLKKMVSHILKIPEMEIDLDADLSEYGFDSISFTTFSNALNDQYKLQLMPSIFYEHPTLLSFGMYLSTEYKDLLAKYYKIGLKIIENKEIAEESIAATENHLKSRYWLPKPAIINATYHAGKEPVAIIGISGVMPQSDDLGIFWRHLEMGKDLVKEIPIDRWDYKDYYGNPKTEPNKTNVKWGGFMNEVDKFDPLFFGISPREAELMDPQQRIFLQTVWKTIEDAGYKTKDISDTNTGIFVGVGTSDYNELLKEKDIDIEAYTSTGISHSVLANRISFLLNLHGPSEPIDTACSSSLVAVHRAVEAIQLGHCDMAIAGGVNVMVSPTLYIAFSKAGMLCEDGRCKTFDKDANGYVRGEGAGAVLLKPLTKAIESGDHIYAVIKGSAVNHGGHVNSLTTPNPNAQADLIIKAWKDTGVDPSTIGYIEAHGTGTGLGDPIEINGLKKAFIHLYKEWGLNAPKTHCGVGSVKTNIGHLETASGIAGLLKVILSMKYKKLPASIHFKALNPYIKLEDSPLYIVNSTRDWNQIGSAPRRAGISSFGFGGANAHIALEEYPETKRNNSEQNDNQIIVLSAKNKNRLKDYVKALIQYIDDGDQMLNHSLTNVQLKDNMLNDLKVLAAKVIKVPVDEIDRFESMDEYGFDPVNLATFYKNIDDLYHLDGKMNIHTGFTSLEKIGEYLLHNHSEQLIRYYPEISTVTNKKSYNNKANISLADIAFTLQVGRDAMDERLAVITDSIKTLRDKLEDYLDGKTDIDKAYFCMASESKNKTLHLIDGEDGQEFINILIRKGKLGKLAELWVNGIDVDWRKLYGERKMKRLALPTYPFAKDRYWISEINEHHKDQANKTANLHPVITENVSTFKEQKFMTILTEKTFYFRDHIIKGTKILPGAAYLEIARAAGELALEEKVLKIQNIIWFRPIIESGKEIKLFTILYPNQNTVDFEVCTKDETGNDILHAQGKLVIGVDKNQNNALIVDINTLKNKCHASISGEECYKKFEKAGFNYKESFQVIQRLYTNEHEALSELKLPEPLTNQLNQFILHPSLIDGAFQTISGISYDRGVTYLPYGLGEIEIRGNLKEVCYAYATMTDHQAKVRKYKIEMLDQEGNVLVRIKDFTLRELKEKQSKSENEDQGLMYYKMEWKEAENKIPDQEHKASGIYLVFDWKTEQFESLRGQVEFKEGKVLLVKQGTDFKSYGEDIYEMNFNDPENYKALFKTLENDKCFPTHIIHLLNSKEQNTNSADKESFNFELDTNLYTMMYLCQNLIEQKPKNKINITYVFHGNKQGNIHYQGIHAFLKTACLECSKIEIKTIQIDSDKVESVTNILIDELKDSGLEIKYAKGHRWQKVMREIKTESLSTVPMIKDNGVYLITGGMGGLGLIFAEYIAKTVKGSIVLTGRSGMDDKKKEILKGLNSHASKVVYIQGDTLVKEQVNRLIDQVKEQFGPITGIIHCAGVIKDAYIIHKTKKDVEEVIAPKLYGPIWLDEATKEEKLDFFVMFSSTSGVFGNSGQADYAYANSFMDHFAIMREQLVAEGYRNGKTLSINWPLWKEGGMQVDAQVEKMLEITGGMNLLEMKEGIDSFTAGLNLDIAQLIVISGYRSKVNKMIEAYNVDHTMKAEKDHKADDTQASTVNNNEYLIDKMKEDLEEMVSNILKLQKDDLDLNEDLSEFGFDSITFTDFSNQINEKYSLNMMPSIFYEHPTLTSFINYLLEAYKDAISSYYRAEVKFLNTEATKENPNTIKHSLKSRLIRGKAHPTSESVAVIGISGIMPQSEDLDMFWSNLVEEKDLITEIPPDRWDWKKFYGNPLREANKTNIIWGGFMKEVDKFDPMFFGISPREAELMDPQQRIFLETVWRTIEDAGYKSKDISGTKTGVFVGVGTSDYNDVLSEAGTMIQAQTATGMAHCVLANRISYLLNLHGPSEPIDTACSSSLVAVHRAVEAIQYGNCEMAIAGGINVIASPGLYISFSQAGMLCEDGRCKTFDQKANGYVRGEGSGAILLKPLSKAIEDGDYIYGVIKGSAVGHGGHVNSLTTPNPNAQAELIIDAWEKANVNPATVGYIEAHGTGTSLGDPIEINGLKKAFEKLNAKWGNTVEKPYCAIGSVKTNIGHLETAAGISGLLKVLLSLKHKKIPASIHFNELNPYIELKDSPFYIADHTMAWNKIGNEPRRAGVSSFGFGGTNAHVVIEEYEEAGYVNQNEDVDNPKVILLSAKSGDNLKSYAEQMLHFVNRENPLKEALNLSNISYTLLSGRDFMEERLAIIASNLDELRMKLESFVKGDAEVKGIYLGSIKEQSKLKVKPRYVEEIKNIVKDKDVDKAAMLWVNGVDIDWTTLCHFNFASKIPLPTYPFSRERYWVTKINEDKDDQTATYPGDVSELEILIALETGEIELEEALILMEDRV